MPAYEGKDVTFEKSGKIIYPAAFIFGKKAELYSPELS